MKEIFKNEQIEITTTGHDFDFIAIVENLTNKHITIDFFDTETSLDIDAGDYIGILADDEGYFILEQFKTLNFLVYEE